MSNSSYGLIQPIRLGAVAAVLLIVSSCTLIDPYVEITGTDRPEGDVKIDQAISYANKVKTAYREGLSDHAKLKNLLGVGLIPLGAATLGLGIADVSSEAVTGLGLTGAAAYGIGTFLESKPTQQAYVLGYNATNCAIDAVLPFQFEEADPVLTAFTGAYQTIDQRIEAVEQQIGAVRTAISSQKALPGASAPAIQALIQRAEQDVVSATAIVDNAKRARSSATKLQREIATAPGRLMTAVDRILGEVYKAIAENQTDLSAVASIIGGLGQSFSQFTRIPDSLVSAKDISGRAAGAITAESEGGLEDDLNELQTRVSALSTDTRRLADLVNLVSEEKPIEALRACGVDPDSIVSEMVIDPSGPVVFTQGQEKEKLFLIRGGARPYQASLSNQEVRGVIVSQPEVFGPTFSVRITAEAIAGTYNVIVRDNSGRRAILEIMVRSETAALPTVPAPADPSRAAFNRLSANNKAKLQTALCLSGAQVDGRWGPTTRGRLIAFQRTRGVTPNGVLTGALASQLLAETEAQIQARCEPSTAERPPVDEDTDVTPVPDNGSEVVVVPTVGEADLSAFANRVNGRTFRLAEGSIVLSILEARADSAAGNVNITLRASGRATTPLTLSDVKSGVLDQRGTTGAGLTNSHVQIVNFAEISPLLTPAGN